MLIPASNSLVLHSATGVAFGTVRLAPAEADPSKGDCIFDVHPAAADRAEGDEVRWLRNRSFERSGEHRYKIGKDGAITISKANFQVILVPAEEGGFRTKPPAPVVTAVWDASGQP